ncbi:MAG TPA: hypothetical protein DEH11_17950 [Actinobacteria bacterium]|nr:hypothetical protein [Actinomycetota bacterium]
MPSGQPASRWRFLVSPRWLGWHLFTVVAVIGMLWLGDWQFHRAESGNALSWAYTFEWPIFALMGVVFWVKTIIDEGKPKEPEAAAEDAGGDLDLAGGDGGSIPASLAARASRPPSDEEAEDPDLDAYNAYLARLNKEVQGHGRWDVGRQPARSRTWKR